MSNALDPLPILQALIRCPSVTPAEGGALDYLEKLLSSAGFRTVRLPFSEAGTPDVDNLYARFGTSPPHFCFAGHTDVVPPGPLNDWTHPPFAGVLADGEVWGRGAVDMKGGIAAFAAAALAMVKDGQIPGSVSFLITGDEEDVAINGTVKVLSWMQANGEVPDHCLVGEPSCRERLGDGVRIGRRGSMDFRLTVTGRQGHVAYPDAVLNPIAIMARMIDRLHSEPLDSGNEWFGPSTLQATSADTGNKAGNVVPHTTRVDGNIRYNNSVTPATLEQLIRDRCDAVVAELGGSYVLECSPNANAFITEPGPIVEVVTSAIRDVTGISPHVNTGGGTSDARFVKDLCPVLEFGPTNRTIHQIDERIRVDELQTLARIYRSILSERYFSTFAP